MEDKINEEVLCILLYRDEKITIDYLQIPQHFLEELQGLKIRCDSQHVEIRQILNFIQETDSFKLLESNYRYCISLSAPYQRFNASINELLNRSENTLNCIYSGYDDNPEKYDLKSNLTDLKNKIYEDVELWSKAYNIRKAYKKCNKEKDILTFSHRISGWANPAYKLTKNFNIRLRTNFGYGKASYFYVKIKYKNIEITPVSEWVNYQYAQFSEIIRYTKSFILKNQYWQQAMEFARDACNCSLLSEEEFIKKYVLEECEEMVDKLEDMMNTSTFTFEGENAKNYQVTKEGHFLIDFRGEKISGALDFIAKITEYNQIAKVSKFIKRIEALNLKIQPILELEGERISVKIEELKVEENVLKPVYEKSLEENAQYNKLKEKLKQKLIDQEILDMKNLDEKKLNAYFNKENPEYDEFVRFFGQTTKDYRDLLNEIEALSTFKENIDIYLAKIASYFNKSRL